MQAAAAGRTANLGRPHVRIATVAEPDATRAAAALHGTAGLADLAEVRLDHLWPAVPDAERATDDLLQLLEASPVPLLATLRPKRQGGRFTGPENVRIGLLQAALQSGFAAADVELDVLSAGGVAGAVSQHGQVVASHHEFGEMPCRSDGLRFLQGMQDLAPSLDKLALTVSSFPDVLRALEFVRAHAQRGGRPAVTTMGHGGALLRALLPFAGNRATYGAATGSAPAAPGQPALADVVAVWRRWGITPDDLDHLASAPRPWLAVLGIPVDHSLSPALHNAALRAAGRPERYGALEVPASAATLRIALHVAPRIGLAGASVTAPHKPDAARIATPDAAVQATGAANCLRFEPDGRVAATNTDATAFARLLRPLAGAGDRALVLGAGGAARAAIHALAGLGVAVLVASRDPAKGAAAAQVGGTWVPWEQRGQAAANVVVNATPLGTNGADPSPLPSKALSGAPAVVELVYAGGPTALQREAAAAGCRVIDGPTFLLEQAVDAYRFWFGAEPRRDVMQLALGASREAAA